MLYQELDMCLDGATGETGELSLSASGQDQFSNSPQFDMTMLGLGWGTSIKILK